MRWLFAETDREKKHRDQTELAMRQWWRAFELKKDQIEAIFFGGPDFGLPDWMQENLAPVCPTLAWEFGPAVHKQGHRLVLTPELDTVFRPLVDTLLACAPSIENWEFYSYRQRDPFPMALETVRGRTGVDASRWVVQVLPRDGACLDLHFFSPEKGGEEQEQAAFVLAESILGEETMEKRIAVVDVATIDTFGASQEQCIPIAELGLRIDSMVQQMLDGLPAVPYRLLSEEDLNWHMVELDPAPVADYAGFSDLIVSGSCVPGMLETVRTPFFTSGKLSRCGEKFCYVKIDGSQEMGVPDRATLQDALDAALRNKEVGCSVGGGTGVRYLYVDFALTDVKKGMDVIRGILRAVHVSKRSWVLFFDHHLSNEWLGIYVDTPSPPVDTAENIA